MGNSGAGVYYEGSLVGIIVRGREVPTYEFAGVAINALNIEVK
jgi:hypothetical protein